MSAFAIPSASPTRICQYDGSSTCRPRSARTRVLRRPRACASAPQPPPPPPPPSSAGPALGARLKAAIESRVLLGNALTPELSAILCVYFVQGALGISRLAVSFFLKDELHLSPGAVASVTAIAMLPWLVKPVYGFLTDAVPLFGFRRRPYLLLSGILGTSSWLYLAAGAHTPFTAVAAMLATAVSVALSDVVADSLVVERARGAPPALAGALQTLCWGSSAFGGLLAAYASGSLLTVISARTVFACTAALPAATAALAALIAEERVPRAQGALALARAAGDRARTLWDAVRDRKVLLPVAFVFVWQAAPSPDSAMFFFSTNVLHFGPEFLGRVRLASSAAALGGLFLYQKLWRSLPVKTLMFRAAVASVPLALTQLILVSRLNVQWGISDKLFAVTDSAVLTALGQVAFMPTLVLAARLCPPGIEGTLFAALMSIYNSSGAVSSELGALLTHALHVTETDFTNLGMLIAICSFSNLLALPLLDFLDEAPEVVEGTPAIGEVEGNGTLVAGNVQGNGLVTSKSMALPVSSAADETTPGDRKAR